MMGDYATTFDPEARASMNIELREESMAALEAHLSIPIAFEVRYVLEIAVVDHGLGGFALSQRPVVPPYVKDYDAIGQEKVPGTVVLIFLKLIYNLMESVA